MARRVHDANMSLPDLYVWHLFIRPDPAGGHALSVLDLHRMVPKVWTASGRFRSLARLHWSMSPHYFDDEIKELLVSTYSADGQIDVDCLARSIRDNAHTLNKRGRDIDRYYARAIAC
jgi:hypothetical protein